MTTQTNDTIERYEINGAGPYAYSWRIFNDSDLTVVALSTDDPPAVVPLTILTHYTVTGANESDGGSITLTSAAYTPYDGYTLDIRSNTPEDQPTSIRNVARFLPEIHEDAYDYLSRQIQDLSRKLDAAIRAPDYEPTLDMTLPQVSVRAGKYQAFDALGKPISSAGTGNDSALRTDLASTTSGADGSRLVGFRHTEAGSVGVSIFTRLRKNYYLRDFGAAGDDTTDDSAAIAACYAACTSAGRNMLMENGLYRVTPGLFPDGVLFDQKVNVEGEDWELCKIRPDGNMPGVRIDNNGDFRYYGRFGISRKSGTGVGLDVWLASRATLERLWFSGHSSHGYLYRAGNETVFRDIVCRNNGGWGGYIDSETGNIGPPVQSANTLRFEGIQDYAANTLGGFNNNRGYAHTGVLTVQNNDGPGFRSTDITGKWGLYTEANVGRGVLLTATAQRNLIILNNVSAADDFEDQNGNNSIIPLHLAAAMMSPYFSAPPSIAGVAGRTTTFSGGTGGGGASGTAGGPADVVGGNAAGGTLAPGGNVRVGGGAGVVGGPTGVIELMNAVQEKRVALTYGTTIAVNARSGNQFDITPSDGVGYTVSNPTNAVVGQRITISHINTTGGGLGGATFDTAFRLAGGWVQPATGNTRAGTFRYMSTGVWQEQSRNAADVPNA